MRSFVPAVVARADVAAPPSGPESGRAEEGGTLPPSSSPPSLRPPRSSPSLRPAGNSVQPRCARASRPREYERSCATQRIRKIFPRGAARGRIRPPACGRRGGGGGARGFYSPGRGGRPSMPIMPIMPIMEALHWRACPHLDVGRGASCGCPRKGPRPCSTWP